MGNKKVNRLFFSVYLTVVIVLFLAYILEVVKGNRTISYFMVFCGFLFIPFIATSIPYFKNKSSAFYAKLAPIGYFILYSMVLFTVDKANPKPIEFAYILPLWVVLPLMHNWKYTLRYAIAVFLINMGQIVMIASTAIETHWLVQAEIQVAALILIGVFSTLMSKQDTDETKKAMDDINREKEAANERAESLKKMTENIGKTVEVVSAHVDNLTCELNKSAESLKQVNEGTAVTADAVQKQISVIDEFARGIESVSNMSVELNSNIESSVADIKIGTDNMSQLLSISNDMAETTENTSVAVEELTKKVNNITEIVGMISTIASQTKILALNAAIEAARAGEAGKGFAVVADEVGMLSQKTADALKLITQEVSDINASADLVYRNTNEIKTIFDNQNNLINETSNALFAISEQTQILSSSFDGVKNSVEVMTSAKETVVESAENISAVSEETAANSSDTMYKTEQSINVLNDVAEEIAQLKNYAANI